MVPSIPAKELTDTHMLAGTPTITAEELAKRLDDPETYPCCSAALQGTAP